MQIAFDMEFTGLHQHTTLISIGLITEEGNTFYAEANDYDQSQLNPWLVENVLRNLHFSPPSHNEDEHWQWAPKTLQMRGSHSEIQRYLNDWFQELLEGPLSWIDYGDEKIPDLITNPQIEMWSDCMAYDWVLFCELFGGALSIPKCLHYIPFDLCTLLKMSGIDPDIDREEFAVMSGIDTQKHNALWDATVIMSCIKRCYQILQYNDDYIIN